MQYSSMSQYQAPIAEGVVRVLRTTTSLLSSTCRLVSSTCRLVSSTCLLVSSTYPQYQAPVAQGVVRVLRARERVVIDEVQRRNQRLVRSPARCCTCMSEQFFLFFFWTFQELAPGSTASSPVYFYVRGFFFSFFFKYFNNQRLVRPLARCCTCMSVLLYQYYCTSALVLLAVLLCQYYYISVRIEFQRTNSSLPALPPHSPTSLSMLIYQCPHTTIYVLVLLGPCWTSGSGRSTQVQLEAHRFSQRGAAMRWTCSLPMLAQATISVSSCYNISVLTTHTAIQMSSCYYINVLILLYMCPHTTT